MTRGMRGSGALRWPGIVSRRCIATGTCATGAGSRDRADVRCPGGAEFPVVPGRTSGQPDRDVDGSGTRPTPHHASPGAESSTGLLR